jgi:hypothetical protein
MGSIKYIWFWTDSLGALSAITCAFGSAIYPVFGLIFNGCE